MGPVTKHPSTCKLFLRHADARCILLSITYNLRLRRLVYKYGRHLVLPCAALKTTGGVLLLCRANDLGLQLFRAKDYGTAFAHYTEAIRLCPRKSTYHCNRAAAALKLQQHAIAAEDARYMGPHSFLPLLCILASYLASYLARTPPGCLLVIS